MSFSMGGPNAEINVDVNVDAAEAARELERRFARAIISALRSAEVRGAVAGLITQITKAMQGFSKSTGQAFKDAERQGKRMTDNLRKGFEQVGKEAQRAFAANTARGAPGELTAINAQLANIGANFQEMANSSARAFKLLEETGRLARAELRGVLQEQRTAQQQARTTAITQTQTQRERIAQLQLEATQVRANAQVQAATIRSHAQRVTQIYRGLQRTFELTWRTATSAVAGFVRAAGSSLRGLGRAADTVFHGIARTAQASFRGMSRLFSTFGRGLTSALSGVSRAFAAAFRRDENALNSSLRRREGAIRGSAARQGQLLGGVGLGGLGAGLAGGAGIGALLTSGFERAGLRERLQIQFSALLGGDAARATQVLQQLSDYARVTAFEFDEVALSTAQLTAAFEGNVERGIELTQFLGDLVALTGGTTAQLGAARLAFSQIAATGRLEGQELNQLLESLPGVPIISILADRFFGGDTAAFQEARRSGELGGKITSDGFFDALEQGMNERFPEFEGFAITASETLTGRLANLKETFTEFGASLVGIAEGPIKSFFGRLTSGFETLQDFIAGTGIFGAGGAEGEQNPFAAAAARDRGAGPTSFTTIPFEELPQEMQDILAERNGWGPNEGFVLAAQHAEELWNQLHPPPDVAEGADRLREIRDIVIDFARGAGAVAALAGSFKLLGSALKFVLRPMTLVLLAGGLLGTLFSRILDASEPLRNSLRFFRETLTPLGEALQGLGGSLLDGLFRLLGAEGTQSGFERIGDFLSRIVDTLSRGVGFLTEWINWASTMIDLGQGDAVLDSIRRFFINIASEIGGFFDNLIRDILPSGALSDLWATIFGTDEAEGLRGGFFQSMEESLADSDSEQRSLGTQILDILEGTFLGPIVRFFRGPFADLVERIGGGIADFGGFLGDIFNAIFGDDPGGIGTRVLDVLEDTFLGPVVRFFRDGRFSEMLASARDFFAPAVETVANAISDAWAVIQPIIQPLLDKLGELLEAVKNWDFSELNLGNIAAGAGLGGLVGLILGGPAGLAIGAIGGALFGAGIGGAIAESIGNAWEMVIRPALVTLWGDITTWFSETFTAENLGTAATFILDFLRDAGELAANVVTDPVFVGAIGGALAAGIAIIGAFTLGLAVGLADSLLQWSDLISDALESAWEAISPDFIPEPITNAISAVLGAPLTGFIAGIGGILLGRTIVTAVIGGITGIGPNLVRGAGGLIGMIFGKSGAGSPTGGRGPFDQDARLDGFRTLGGKIAGALMGALVAGIVGYQAGQAGGTGNLILALLTGTAGGAALGFSIGGPVGAGVGAALGLAAAAIGAGFGSSAREADALNEKIQYMRDLLEGVEFDPFGGLETGAGGAAVASGIFDLLTDAAEADGGQAGRDWTDQFIANLDFERLGQQVADGIATPTSALENFLTGMTDDVVAATDLTAAEWQSMVEEMSDALASGDIASVSPEFIESLDAAGFSVDDLNNAMAAIAPILQAADAAWDRASIADDIAALDPSPIQDVGDAVEAISEVLGRTDLGIGEQVSEIIGLLSSSDLSATDQFEALEQAADAAADAVGRANSELADFFREQLVPQTVNDVLRNFRLDLPDVGEQFTQELQRRAGGEGIEVPAQVVVDVTDATVADFRETVANALAEGIESGATNEPAEIDEFIAGLTTAINDAVESGDLDADLGARFLEVVGDVDAAAASTAGQELIDAVLNAEGNAGIIDAAASTFQTEVVESFGNFEGVDNSAMWEALADPTAYLETLHSGGVEARDAVVAGFTGTGTGGGGTAAVGITRNPDAAGIGDSLIGSVVEAITGAVDEVTAAGQRVGAGFGRGLASTIQVSSTVARLAGFAVVAGVRVEGAMYSAGANAGNALARGLISQVRAAATAAAIVAIAVVSAARNALRITSPSKVFIDIGKQVGQGFIQGIKDSEGDMAAAIGDSLEKAITLGVERAGSAVQRAQAAGRIFELLAPSLLPGGTTDAARLQDFLGTRLNVGTLGAGFRERAAGALGDSGRLGVANAAAEVRALGRSIAGQVIDMRGAFREATAQQASIDKYAKTLKQINADYKSGALGQREYNERLREMRENLAVGSLSQDSFNDQLKVLNNQLRLGILNREARESALSELGQRPTGLTYQQQQLIRFGAATLDPAVAQGVTNREMVVSSLETIRAWGQEALNAGQSLNTVIASMKQYRNSLVNQLKSLGFNITHVNNLVAAAGLSDAALQQLRGTLTDLRATTAAGISNIQTFLEQFISIREFGQRALESGVPLANVISQMKAFRNSVVDQAVAFGFNRTELTKLVNQVGLSDAALADFITQLQAFDKEAAKANQTARDAAEAARIRREQEAARDPQNAPVAQPGIRDINVHITVPHGDPEAIGLAAANRLAADYLGR